MVTLWSVCEDTYFHVHFLNEAEIFAARYSSRTPVRHYPGLEAAMSERT